MVSRLRRWKMSRNLRRRSGAEGWDGVMPAGLEAAEGGPPSPLNGPARKASKPLKNKGGPGGPPSPPQKNAEYFKREKKMR